MAKIPQRERLHIRVIKTKAKVVIMAVFRADFREVKVIPSYTTVEASALPLLIKCSNCKSRLGYFLFLAYLVGINLWLERFHWIAGGQRHLKASKLSSD